MNTNNKKHSYAVSKVFNCGDSQNDEIAYKWGHGNSHDIRNLVLIVCI